VLDFRQRGLKIVKLVTQLIRLPSFKLSITSYGIPAETMHLCMYLDSEMIDCVPLNSFAQVGYKDQMTILLTKHKDILQKSMSKPTFCFERIPSSINGFTPLQMSPSNQKIS
jgi:hypothetical protein